jgi:hypothetical protein
LRRIVRTTLVGGNAAIAQPANVIRELVLLSIVIVSCDSGILDACDYVASSLSLL